ncbi:MAG TPA: hypothetical protein VFA26_03855, partial [Gemmataceae bacterium]|nr:hypothetical protein [Gemmataceae bacterium]
AKGCVLTLVRRGAWRRERFLRGDGVADGRLWQRTPPTELGLAFSRHSLRFLVWATAQRPTNEQAAWKAPEKELTVADRLLLFLAYESVRGFPHELAALQRMPAFCNNVLCRLMYPEDFAALAGRTALDFGPWTTGVGACILESLHHNLAARWVAVERSKFEVEDWQEMRALGQSQEEVLAPFLKAVEDAGRLDLARFLLRAAAILLTPDAEAAWWRGRITRPGPRLADRADTHRAALALLRQVERMHAWERQARGVGYFDEGYQASQLWKADWERQGGESLHQRARAIIQQLDPMRPTGGSQP